MELVRAMAWPVTAHSLLEPLVMPEREWWAHDLAWTQWSLAELASGEAWAALVAVREPVHA